MTEVTPRRAGPSVLSPESLAGLDPRVSVPAYERDGISPSIVHIGVGGFHRAHLANYVHQLCAAGHKAWGICGSGVLPHDARMAEVLLRQRGLYALITRGANETDVAIIGSILGFIHAAPDPEVLVDKIAAPETRIVSMTLTEGGYPVNERTREFDPTVAPSGTGSAFGILVAALDRRRKQGHDPVTVISCDNVVGNGDVARAAALGMAENVNPVLRNWIERTVPFPNSMVDRITPATVDSDREWLAKEYGIVDGWPVVTEPFHQWVLEDSFAGVRPHWEDVGITMTSNVEPYELMKLRLLNAGHSTMAYLAAVAGIEKVDGAMREPGINGFLRQFLAREAEPVLPDIPGIDIPSYEAKLIERFSNPAIGDQIARLCLDGSAKFPKFLLPTIRAQLDRSGPVDLSALALAGWCHYLAGVADDGSRLALASDPDLEHARGFAEASSGEPARFLEYRAVFGDDLPRAPRFVEAFERALRSLRSLGVRRTLDAYLT